MGRFSKTIEQKPASGKRLSRRKLVTGAGLGYGMMLLVMFITSTVLIGTSVQMLLGSGTASYLGTYSQDSAAATEVAQSGMETVLSDIQSRLNAGTSVTTAYTYNSNTSSTNIVMPTDPSSLGGGNTTIGTYTATMTAARGNTYLVQVSANVNTASVSYSKLFTISRIGNLLDGLSGGGANAAYSLRKLRSAYAGSAIRVRRSSDNTEQDIGFDGSGNLDVSSLKTFISASTMPLDSVGSAAAAYGLRKLRTAYTGYCLNVRRSSDSTTQDIGFTSAGDLDTGSLLSFVGTGTGYVATWYDQSGNGTNATQATTTLQPTIVVSGVLNTVNNRPTITFDGVDDYLALAQAVSNDMTIMACYNAITGSGAAGTVANSEARLIDSYSAATTNDFVVGIDSSGNVNAFVGNPDSTNGSYATSSGAPGDNRMHWMTFTRTQATGYYSVYNDQGSYSDGNGNTATLSAKNAIRLASAARDSLSEVLMYSSVLSSANQQTLQRNEGWYYNMYPIYSAITPPLDAVTSALPSYGLRKLRAAFAGSAIRVRRSSDNTEQNIGFDINGNLDVASLLTFVGNGSGYVKTWYDQSTTATRDATQATTANQPRIVNAGVLDTQNGKPSLYFCLGCSMATSAFTGFSSAHHVQAMAKVLADYVNENALVSKANGNIAAPFDFHSALHYNGDGTGYNWATSTAAATFNAALPYSSIGYDASASTANTWVNGNFIIGISGSLNYGDSGTSIVIGSRNDNYTKLNGYVSEVLTYSSQLSTANRQTLERNQLQYFAPPLDAAFVSKWYDQSVNGYDLTQTNPVLQPSLMMPPYGNNSLVPTVMFNGGQFLSNTSGMISTADYSKVAVFSYFDSTKSNDILGAITNNNPDLYMGGTSGTPSNALMVTNYNSGAGSAIVTSSLTLATNTHYAVATTYTQTTPVRTFTLYRSNSSGGTSSTGHSNSDTSIELGAYNARAGQANYGFLNGTISEAMIFARSLSTTDQTAIYTDEQNYFSSQ